MCSDLFHPPPARPPTPTHPMPLPIVRCAGAARAPLGSCARAPLWRAVAARRSGSGLGPRRARERARVPARRPVVDKVAIVVGGTGVAPALQLLREAPPCCASCNAHPILRTSVGPALVPRASGCAPNPGFLQIPKNVVFETKPNHKYWLNTNTKNLKASLERCATKFGVM